MRISALEEYGLRCLLRLANLPERECTSAAKIADQEGMSLQYASKILHLCRKAGIVESVRGTNGGFRLQRPANEITLYEIFQSVAGRKDFNEHFCEKFTGNESSCVHIDDCSIRPVWYQLTSFFDSILLKLRLSDLCHSESTVAQAVRNTAAQQASLLSHSLQRKIQNG